MGPLLTQGEREALFEEASMNEFRKQSQLSDMAKGTLPFDTLPLPHDLASVVQEVQRLAWFCNQRKHPQSCAQHRSQTRGLSNKCLVCLCFLLFPSETLICPAGNKPH